LCSGWIVASLDRKRLGQDARENGVADPRRFRLGDEKEGAGAADAVIWLGAMGFESGVGTCVRKLRRMDW
jgi:hypothetical protein